MLMFKACRLQTKENVYFVLKVHIQTDSLFKLKKNNKTMYDVHFVSFGDKIKNMHILRQFL